MERKIGTVLPGGNEPEYEDIRDHLKNRDVQWFERRLGGNATIFWMFESELTKLPFHRESQGKSRFAQYLPVDDVSGHALSILDKYLEENKGDDVAFPQ